MRSKGIFAIIHASELFDTELVAGPYHPAFRELCDNKIYFDKIENAIKTTKTDANNIKVFVNDKNISKAVGQNRNNIEKFKRLGYNVKVYPDKSLLDYQIKLV